MSAGSRCAALAAAPRYRANGFTRGATEAGGEGPLDSATRLLRLRLRARALPGKRVKVREGTESEVG